MNKINDIVLAVKSAPELRILSDIEKAGICGVELYLNGQMLGNLDVLIALCRRFSFSYAVHAPHDLGTPDKLSELVKAIGAKIVVFHNIYWEDEWLDITKIFTPIKTKLCVENTHSVHEPLKFMRRFGLGRCLDVEHLQLECCGVYEEEFLPVIKDASHIHLTGYVFGSDLWHTHLHQSPDHSLYMLDLIRRAGYSGFVVSEARASLQTYFEFKKLNDFYMSWKEANKATITKGKF
ncbi:MAG: sugar phosphate isomerase/epimerase [Candidatus Omnitrophica bacterium]|nr:sugar phosphate isomerase/epimerase [Candidatus Omnitrophota bacterium]